MDLNVSSSIVREQLALRVTFISEQFATGLLTSSRIPTITEQSALRTS